MTVDPYRSSFAAAIAPKESLRVAAQRMEAESQLGDQALRHAAGQLGAVRERLRRAAR